MEITQVLRAVRALRGWSQRDLAEMLNTTRASVGQWETGRRIPNAQVLVELLRLADLDLALAAPLPEPSAELVAHLSVSTSRRLFSACGGSGPLGAGYRTGPPLWRALIRVAHHGRVVLPDQACSAVWLPGQQVVPPLAVQFHQAPGWSAPPFDEPTLLIEHVPTPSMCGLVPVSLDGYRQVYVRGPDELALRAATSAQALPLRMAAALLHTRRGRDRGARRQPPHRHPRERREAEYLRSVPAYDQARDLPEPLDSRGSRLASPVSLDQWLLARRQPPRHLLAATRRALSSEDDDWDATPSGGAEAAPRPEGGAWPV